MLLQARQGIGHDWVVTARNGEHGYGWVTKTLHWLTFGLLVATVWRRTWDWSSAGGCADDPCCSAGCSSRRWWSSAELTSMTTRSR